MEQLLQNWYKFANANNIDPFTQDEVLFPYEHLSEEHLVIDLIYNPSKTVFLKKSEDNGAQILNGSSMLSEQAMKSWQIWIQKD